MIRCHQHCLIWVSTFWSSQSAPVLRIITVPGNVSGNFKCSVNGMQLNRGPNIIQSFCSGHMHAFLFDFRYRYWCIKNQIGINGQPRWLSWMQPVIRRLRKFAVRPFRVGNILLWRSDHETFSTVILALLLIQEGKLSVSGKRMCTILVNRLED